MFLFCAFLFCFATAFAHERQVPQGLEYVKLDIKGPVVNCYAPGTVLLFPTLAQNYENDLSVSGTISGNFETVPTGVNVGVATDCDSNFHLSMTSGPLSSYNCVFNVSMPAADRLKVTIDMDAVVDPNLSGNSDQFGVVKNFVFFGFPSVVATAFPCGCDGSAGSFSFQLQHATLDFVFNYTVVDVATNAIVASGSRIDGDVSVTVNHVAAGTYSIRIVNADSTYSACGVSTTVTITQAPSLSMTAPVPAELPCGAGPVGVVSLSATGGTPPYAYSRDDENQFQSASTFTGLAAGQHHFTVRDAMGCTFILCVNVTQRSSAPCGSIFGKLDISFLTRFLFVFLEGCIDGDWQSSSRGYYGDVLLNGLKLRERSSGFIPFAGNIYTNANSLAAWSSIWARNMMQANAYYRQVGMVQTARQQFDSAIISILSMPVTPQFASLSASDLNGINTQNNVAEVIVINVVRDFSSIRTKLVITGDACDIFILRWDDNLSCVGFQGTVRFLSGGAIVPAGGLTPGNFIHVAGDIDASGGGSNPPAPYPQGPRFADGTLIRKGADWRGGGFFTGYWLTTGNPITGISQPVSNAIFVGGWYTNATAFFLTNGSSGIHVAPFCCGCM